MRPDHCIKGVWSVAATLVVVAACSDPSFNTPAAVAPEEVCAASAEWLPGGGQPTPPLDPFMPAPHPASDCPFYRGAWQSFLVAMEPGSDGTPAMMGYPTIDELFVSSKPPAAKKSVLGDIRQAGQRNVLVDQNGRAIYYSINVNQGFANFVQDNHLTTADAIRNAPTDLFIPAQAGGVSVVTYKAAWQVVDSANPPGDFITIKTTVPKLAVDPTTHRIVEDKSAPIEVTAAMLAVHVVFTLPGHPEMIWATFEHSAGTPDWSALQMKRDVAPNGGVNPPSGDRLNLMNHAVVSDAGAILYKSMTTAAEGNQPISEDAGLIFDPSTQLFSGFGIQSSIYRMFPASKSNTTTPDPAISSLNFNVEKLFAAAAADNKLATNDRRGHYRLVGAIWLDKPAYFKLDSALRNDKVDSNPLLANPGAADSLATDGSDSEFSILGGEDRLSSTAMESFTQPEDSFYNCLRCHNTEGVNQAGTSIKDNSQSPQLLTPKLFNVSHIFSAFLLEEAQP